MAEGLEIGTSPQSGVLSPVLSRVEGLSKGWGGLRAFKGRFLGHDRHLSRDSRGLQFGHRGW